MGAFKDELKNITDSQQTEKESKAIMNFAQRIASSNCDRIRSGLLAAAKNRQNSRDTIKFESTIASVRLDQIDKDHIPPKSGWFCAFEDSTAIRSLAEQKDGCVIYELEIIADIRSLLEEHANIVIKGTLTEAGSYILNEIKSCMKQEDVQTDYFIRYTYSSFGNSYTDEILTDYHKFSMYFLRKTVDIQLCCRAVVV